MTIAHPAPLAAPAPVDLPPTGEEPLVSGEAVELEVRMARLGSRMLALLLDIVIQIVVFVPISVVIQVLGLGAISRATVNTLSILLIVLVFVGYPVGCEMLFRGRSVGKLIVGLRVVRDDGGPIRFRHSITRAVVGVSLEWPGVLLPPLTWLATLTTMLTNRHGKRLGDLAAGTIVIHDRTPQTWGWVPAMPPHLAGWARILDLTGLDDNLALAVRHYLARNRQLSEPSRSRLGMSLAAEVAARVTPPPPPGVPGWAYLAAVVAERHRRALYRLAVARAATARVFPGLGAPPPGG